MFLMSFIQCVPCSFQEPFKTWRGSPVTSDAGFKIEVPIGIGTFDLSLADHEKSQQKGVFLCWIQLRHICICRCLFECLTIIYQYLSRSPMLGLRFFSARWRNWHTRERTWWMDLIWMSLMVFYGDIRCYFISWIYHSNWQLVIFLFVVFFLLICWLMIFVRLRWYTVYSMSMV